MKIAICGLGLIGGSLAKAIKKNTPHTVYGMNRTKSVVDEAIKQEAVDYAITPEELKNMDIVILGLYPQKTVDFVMENIDNFKKGAIVADTCGIKEYVVNALEKPLADKGVYFLGCHPMAGREFSGFAYATDNLFENASMIVTPTENTPAEVVAKMREFSKETGFERYVVTTPQEHDQIIAYTSQLAHVVSSAYIKSPTCKKQVGFSAGSFKDLTRVAKLNPEMWTSLFLKNKKALVEEIDCIIKNLTEYRDLIDGEKEQELYESLAYGTKCKEDSIAMNVKRVEDIINKRDKN